MGDDNIYKYQGGVWKHIDDFRKEDLEALRPAQLFMDKIKRKIEEPGGMQHDLFVEYINSPNEKIHII